VDCSSVIDLVAEFHNGFVDLAEEGFLCCGRGGGGGRGVVGEEGGEYCVPLAEAEGSGGTD
jgi:hypothetical protein